MKPELVAASRSSGGGTPTTFLHIGTMKTGTSFLQSVLLRNQAALAEEGVIYPVDDTRWAMQVRATRDVLSIKGEPAEGAWDALTRCIHAWPGRAAVVSMEFFSLASAPNIRKVVHGLSPTPVEVIITARDLVRVVPSAWQSMVKQGRPWSFPEFVTSITDSTAGDADAYRRFWRHHDLPAIARKWADVVGATHVHLVTVPPPAASPSLLWERFCSVVGIDPSRYATDQDKKSNFSLSYSDTELLRQVNLALGDDLTGRGRKKWATRFLANRVLRADAGEETADDRPVLGVDAHGWAVERSRQDVAALASMGVHVVGDLYELMPAPQGPDAPAESPAPRVTYPDRAGDVVAALVRRLAQVDPGIAKPRSRTSAPGDPDLDDLVLS